MPQLILIRNNSEKEEELDIKFVFDNDIYRTLKPLASFCYFFN